MNVVINRCYGGFGLSYAAIMRYAELANISLYRYFDATTKRIYGDDYRNGCAHYTTKPIPGVDGDVLRVDDGSASKFLNDNYWSDYGLDRSDPYLVAVVEELGEQANGPHASLCVVDIPDGIEYEIDEYDGIEHVAEKHRTWS